MLLLEHWVYAIFLKIPRHVKMSTCSNTVWYCHTATNFLRNPYNRHPIARPIIKAKYRVPLTSFKLLVYVMLQLRSAVVMCFKLYRVILDRVIITHDCIFDNYIRLQIRLNSNKTPDILPTSPGVLYDVSWKYSVTHRLVYYGTVLYLDTYFRQSILVV